MSQTVTAYSGSTAGAPGSTTGPWTDAPPTSAIDAWHRVLANNGQGDPAGGDMRATVAPASQAATGRAPGGQAPAAVTADRLRAIMPDAGDEVDRYVEPLNQAMAAHGIDTPEQRAAFLAQVSVESGQLRHTVENLHYSARRLTEVWPRRLPTQAAATPYAHTPEALADRVYANRLGNGDEASGDGFRFRGRGLMQVTGRDNHRRVGFENIPEALAEPQNAADTAAAFWVNNGLNGRTTGVLDRAGFDAVSRTVNGGDHGSQARWGAYQRALQAFDVGR